MTDGTEFFGQLKEFLSKIKGIIHQTSCCWNSLNRMEELRESTDIFLILLEHYDFKQVCL